MFGTAAGLDWLADNGDWFMDGTFKTVPSLFTQLYTIHGFRLNNAIPSVYVLLRNKKKTYVRMLEGSRGFGA